MDLAPINVRVVGGCGERYLRSLGSLGLDIPSRGMEGRGQRYNLLTLSELCPAWGETRSWVLAQDVELGNFQSNAEAGDGSLN